MWTTALRRMCLDSAVFLPTFPIDQMTVGSLEREAIAPFIWISQYKRKRSSIEDLNEFDNKLLPSMTREINFRDGALCGFCTLFLVPGGRFLFSFHSKDICLWDLGYNLEGSKPFISEPIARMQIWAFYVENSIYETPDKLGIRLVLRVQERGVR